MWFKISTFSSPWQLLRITIITYFYFWSTPFDFFLLGGGGNFYCINFEIKSDKSTTTYICHWISESNGIKELAKIDSACWKILGSRFILKVAGYILLLEQFSEWSQLQLFVHLQFTTKSL